MAFRLDDIPDQTGKLAVITGATGGLGYQTALALAGANGTVVLTGRNADKGAIALAGIRAAHPRARVSFEMLDLARLGSVSQFAERFGERHRRLDILVNNAGVMALPRRAVTPDGFEVQFQVDFLSHFALTAHLLPFLAVTARPRVVQLSSIYAGRGTIDFADLQSARGYRPWTAYAQAKLAMLIFALELHRRSERAGWGIVSTAAHPGFARTELVANGPGSGGLINGIVGAVISNVIGPFIGQSAAEGALPQIFAATSPEAAAGTYYGPTGRSELTGAPGLATLPNQALDENVASRLWAASEALSRTRFPTLASAA